MYYTAKRKFKKIGMGKKEAENEVKHECLNNFQLNEKHSMEIDDEHRGRQI